MKKLLYSTLAIAAVLAASCSQEKSTNDAVSALPFQTHEITLKGAFSPQTRTAYANDKTFSWLDNEAVYVISYDDDYTYANVFRGGEAGTVTDFKGELTDGATVAYAMYPAFGRLFINKNIAAFLPSRYYVDETSDDYFTVQSSNPLENLPLVGVLDENDILQFYTAAGAAKFTLTGLKAGSKIFRIYSNKESLSGYFALDSEKGYYTNDSALSGTYTVESTYTTDSGEERDTTYTLNCSNKYVDLVIDTDNNGTLTGYFPLPVGKISAGAQIMVYDLDEEGNGTIEYSRVLSRDISIERNKVTEVATLACVPSSWKSAGTASFIDNYTWQSQNFTEGQKVSVSLAQDENNKNLFRIENPFKVAATTFNYQPAGTVSPDEYLEFAVIPGNDQVSYDEIYTGIYNSDIEGEMMFASPGLFNNADPSRNIVTKYQENGLPAHIQFDPVYFFDKGYWSWFTNGEDGGGYLGTKLGNNIASLYFPGVTEGPDLALKVLYTGDAIVDEEGAVVTATVDFGNDITGVQLVIAQSEKSALAAIEAGTNVTSITSPNTDIKVTFPAGAATGTYYLYAYTSVTDGLTQACRQLIAAEDGISYFNPNDEDKYTLDNIIGYWYTKTAEIYDGDGWETGEFDATIEASNDEDSGNVMITEMWGFTFDVPMYGTFDTQKGLLQIKGEQIPITTSSPNTSYYFGFTKNGDPTGDLNFYLSDDGTLSYEKGETILLFAAYTKRLNNTYAGWLYAFDEIYMEKQEEESTSGAPALVKADFSSAPQNTEITTPAPKNGSVSFERKNMVELQEPMFIHLGKEAKASDMNISRMTWMAK